MVVAIRGTVAANVMSERTIAFCVCVRVRILYCAVPNSEQRKSREGHVEYVPEDLGTSTPRVNPQPPTKDTAARSKRSGMKIRNNHIERNLGRPDWARNESLGE